MFALAALMFFLAVTLVGYAIASTFRERETAREQIRDRLGRFAGDKESVGSILKDQRLSSIGFLNRLLPRLSLTAGLGRLIQQAGLTSRVGEVVLQIPLISGVGFLVGMLVTSNFLLSVIIGLSVAVIPISMLQRRRRKRLALFSEQLPDALDLVRAALQAGHSFVTAMTVVADEFPEPVAGEFRTVAEEMRLGLPMREALYNLRDRVDDPNVPILIVGVLIVQEVGGNMAEVLDNVSYTIRERFKLLRDAQVMTAQGRLSGRVLTALPVLVGLVTFLFNPLYFAPMIETRIGWGMMGYALLSITLGHIIIQRIVRIQV